HHKRGESGLTPEQVALVEKTYDDFVRSGAGLDPEKHARVGAINQTLAKLYADFGKRVQADEDTWLTLGPEDLDGLPESLVQAYAAAAKERGVDGHIVVNTRSAVDPFLSLADRRALRNRGSEAYVTRADRGDEHDTTSLIRQLVTLRAEGAELLGSPIDAHYRVIDTLAKDAERAEAL